MKDWLKIKGKVIEVTNILDNTIAQVTKKYDISYKEIEKVRQ